MDTPGTEVNPMKRSRGWPIPVGSSLPFGSDRPEGYPSAMVRGATKPRLLGVLGVGIGIELGWLDSRSDPDADADADDQPLWL